VIAYRYASYSTPLRTIADSRAARFHRGGEVGPTQYLSLHPLGPLAELMRNNDLRTSAQLAHIRVRTWALVAAIDELEELTFDTAGKWGLSAADVVADDHGACQALADELRVRGVAGVIVPSAALPGTRNVVLFGPRVAAPYLTKPVSTLDVPASITAEDGRPPTSLIEAVRFVGDGHAALDAWRRGDSFEFVEPSWAVL
jgi:RES domain-containing protein